MNRFEIALGLKPPPVEEKPKTRLILTGPRCSGKTTELLKYLTNLPAECGPVTFCSSCSVNHIKSDIANLCGPKLVSIFDRGDENHPKVFYHKWHGDENELRGVNSILIDDISYCNVLSGRSMKTIDNLNRMFDWLTYQYRVSTIIVTCDEMDLAATTISNTWDVLNYHPVTGWIPRSTTVAHARH